MTERYDLTLKIDHDGHNILFIKVDNKTMATLQSIIRLSTADFDKVDQLKQRKFFKRAQRIIPPDPEPINEPTEKDIENI